MILDGGVGTELPQFRRRQGRPRRAAVGHARADREPRRRPARAPRVRPGRLRRHLDQHLGPRLARSRPTARACGRTATRPCTGWTSGAAGCGSPARRCTSSGRDGECAVAFSLNGDVDSDEAAETIRLLAAPVRRRAEPPDLDPARDAVAAHAHARRRDRGPAGHRPARVAVLPALPPRPVRHLRPALGRPRGRRLRARRRGASRRWASAALLINCIPPDHVAGMVSYLRDFTDLPLGVYPNLGYYSDRGWRFDPRRGRRGVRRDGAALARGGRADRRRLLRRAPRAHRRRARSAWRARRPATGAGRDAHRRPQRRGPPAPVAAPSRGRTAAGARCTRCRSPTSASSPASRARRGQLHGLALRVRRGHRRAPALPGHRLRHGHPRRPARPQRRRPRARARHRRPRGGQHAGQRLPQRRRRPGHRGDRRPLPVGPRGALRGRRREPLPEAHRPVRAACRATGCPTTGGATSSTS